MGTIKEEKKAEYETIWQLMKGLRDKWWIPRWYKGIVRAVYDRRHKMIWLYEDDWKEYLELVSKKSLRELASTDSWLWQFVCDNGMVKHEVYEDIQSWEHTTAEHSDFWYTSWDNYEFYLIESALKDESEIEDFLLSNIVIKDE